jgi:hypothetical protein
MDVETPVFQKVNYWVYSIEPKPVPIKAISCSQWIRRKIVATGWLGNTDIAISSYPKETSMEECAAMNISKSCRDNFMLQTGKGEWAFNEEPTGGSAWGQTVKTDQINCRLQDIYLAHPCVDCAIRTPVGLANFKDGTASGRHVRFLWSTHQPIHAPCGMELIQKGIGFLTGAPNATIWRLQDPDQQVDFHLEAKPTRCACVKPCVKPAHGVINNKFIFVKWSLVNATSDDNTPHSPSPADDDGPSWPRLHSTFIQSNDGPIRNLSGRPISTLSAAHLQFITDSSINMANELARDLLIIQCEQHRMKFTQALLLAQINPWLAAQQLKLRQCSRIMPIGDLAIIQQCKPISVLLQTITTSCGHQLRFQNYTVSQSGFELIPYQPCTSSSEYRFIAGKDRFDGTLWNLATPHLLPPHHDLIHLFNYPNDISFAPTATNPGQQDFPSTILEAIDEVRDRNGLAGPQLPEASSPFDFYASQHTTIWDRLKSIAIITLIIISILLITKLLHTCGVFTMIFDSFVFWCCCCYPSHRRVLQNDSVAV